MDDFDIVSSMLASVLLDDSKSNPRPLVFDQQTQTDDVNVTEKIVKTPVSIFQELCTAFDLGVPTYNIVEEKGEGHKKSFLTELTTDVLGVKVVGEGRSKVLSKHDAATQLIEMIKETAEYGGEIGDVPHQTLQECHKKLTNQK